MPVRHNYNSNGHHPLQKSQKNKIAGACSKLKERLIPGETYN